MYFILQPNFVFNTALRYFSPFSFSLEGSRLLSSNHPRLVYINGLTVRGEYNRLSARGENIRGLRSGLL